MSHNQCSMCSTKFSSNEQLKEHIIQSHEGKLFVCPYEDCYIAYATKKGLKYHQGTHTMKQFNSSMCSLSFNSLEELQTHKKNPNIKIMPRGQSVQDVVKFTIVNMRQDVTLIKVVCLTLTELLNVLFAWK